LPFRKRPCVCTTTGVWLVDRDSNPDDLMNNPACCRWTSSRKKFWSWRRDLHPQSPAYDAGAFLLSHASKIWRPRSDSHRHITLLQSVALLFGDSAVAERTGLEPACPCGLHVSTVVACRLAYLSLFCVRGSTLPGSPACTERGRLRRPSRGGGGGRTCTSPPMSAPRFQRGGPPAAQRLREVSGSPSETRTRICSLKDC
jgi:hypothetical protein